MSLKGAPELRRRLRAIVTVARPVRQKWAKETASVLRASIPVRTGRTRRSIQPAEGRVTGSGVVNFIDAGVRAHDIQAVRAKAMRFSDRGYPVFRRKVHKRAQAARPIKRKAAEEGLRRADPIGEMVNLWNRAA